MNMKMKSEKLYKINNRKYLGSKTKLLKEIYSTVESLTKGKYSTLIDIFGGTGSVSNEFIRRGKKVIVNDFLDSNFIIYKAFFENDPDLDRKKIRKIRSEFNCENFSKGSNYFSVFGDGKYFTKNDATKIGNIREEIERKFRKKEINFRERDILIASLIYSADSAANSMGHYEIYIERDIKDKFEFNLIDIDNLVNAEEIYGEDANSLIRNLKADVLYLDPPYNSRQYSNLYHLLDNLAKWDNPTLFGKGLKPEFSKKSKYSLKDAREAMLDLVLNADVKYIFISYNNTNLAKNSRTAAKISDEEMISILKLRGKVTKKEIAYNPYNTGNSELKDYKELIYICEVNTEPLKRMKVKYPFNYMGGKFKLLDSIKVIEANNINDKDLMVDVFAGGANVSANLKYKNILAFDINEKQIEILNALKNEDTFELLDKIDNVIDEFGLSKTHINGYEFYDAKGNTGLKEFNNDKYIKLRESYNLRPNLYKLIVLIIYSFNNSINFNSRGEFNIPCGKRDFNSNMRKNFMLFTQRLKNINITFIHSDFRNVSKYVASLGFENVLYYFDPPYISGFAHYNKSWTVTEESDLLDWISNISDNWILSNSLQIGKNSNHQLDKFIENGNHNITYLNNNYDNSWFHKKEKGNKEIILTNISKDKN